LPRIDIRTSTGQDTQVEVSPRHLHIGCAGWNIPRLSSHHFQSAGSHLVRYARVFRCCEINSSFYRPHQLKTWARWAESVPKDFQFSVKAPRFITHETRLMCGPEALSNFFAQLVPLGGKLGPVLFQLPPSLEFLSKPVRRFLEQMREMHGGLVVFEPRHPSWFEVEAEFLLRQFRVARAAADPACVSAASVPGAWPGLAYYRLHGSPRMYYSTYGRETLKGISSKIEHLEKHTSVWCIFDNTALGAAASNALELMTMTNNALYV
jgi:uncharacterized protein YecE (DUF72 family)